MSAEAISEHESVKEMSEGEGFDYVVCPPTVKWLLYPDDDEEEDEKDDDKVSSKSIHYNFNLWLD